MYKQYIRPKAGALLEKWPQAWRTVQMLRYFNRPFVRRIVSSQHDILIEGYPRCANSFAVRAFLFKNGWRDVRIATHTHSPAQVILAAQWHVPALVLIRSPDEAVPSLLALGIQLGTLQTGGMSHAAKVTLVKHFTHRYVEFYSRIEPYRDRYVLASFSDATHDFGSIIRRVNQKFSRDFEEFSHTKDNVEKIFLSSKKHLSPNAEREQIKKDLQEIYIGPDNEESRACARATFTRVLSTI